MSSADVCRKTICRGSRGLLLAVLLLAATPLTAGAQIIEWEPLSLDFGGVLFPDGKRTLTLTLTNTDTDLDSEDLSIDSIEFTFNDRGAFALEGTRPPKLPAVLGRNESLEADFSFEPPDFSFFFGDVLITNNSTNAPSLVYQLLGEGSFATTTTIGTTTTTTTTITTTTTTIPMGTTTTMPLRGCGDPVADGGGFTSVLVTASDALFVLNTSVGLRLCEACVCDVNDSGSVTATDALVTLNKAVGLPVSLLCPACS